MKTCDMTIYVFGEGLLRQSGLCGKPAKYKSPEKIMGRIYYLCGIHKNSLNKFYEKLGNNKRCIKLQFIIMNDEEEVIQEDK